MVALAFAGCVPGGGTCRLPAVEGRVADAGTGAPIAGATVIEWWHGAGVGGAPQPTRHARFATSDARGRFAFPAQWAPDPRMWVTRVYAPAYGFVHPAYGFVRGPGAHDAGGALVLHGSLADAPARRSDLEVLCTTPPREAWQRELARRACPARTSDPPGATRSR